MKCYACNVNLNDYESTRKSRVTGDYMDLCNKCFKGLDIQVFEEEDYTTSVYEDPDYNELGILAGFNSELGEEE